MVTVEWPRRDYLRATMNAWNRQRNSSKMITRSASDLQLARLTVYAKSPVYERIVELPSYSIWDLLSTAGGTLGLYGGISLVSILEIVELAFLLNAFALKHVMHSVKKGQEMVYEGKLAELKRNEIKV